MSFNPDNIKVTSGKDGNYKSGDVKTRPSSDPKSRKDFKTILQKNTEDENEDENAAVKGIIEETDGVDIALEEETKQKASPSLFDLTSGKKVRTLDERSQPNRKEKSVESSEIYTQLTSLDPKKTVKERFTDQPSVDQKRPIVDPKRPSKETPLGLASLGVKKSLKKEEISLKKEETSLKEETFDDVDQDDDKALDLRNPVKEAPRNLTSLGTKKPVNEETFLNPASIGTKKEDTFLTLVSAGTKKPIKEETFADQASLNPKKPITSVGTKKPLKEKANDLVSVNTNYPEEETFDDSVFVDPNSVNPRKPLKETSVDLATVDPRKPLKEIAVDLATVDPKKPLKETAIDLATVDPRKPLKETAVDLATVDPKKPLKETAADLATVDPKKTLKEIVNDPGSVDTRKVIKEALVDTSKIIPKQSEKSKFTTRFATEQTDLSSVNPLAALSTQQPSVNLSISTEKAVIPVKDIQEIINQMVEKVTEIKTTGSTDTVITLKNPPMFQGATIVVTAFDSAKNEFNISIENLTQAGKQLMDQQGNKDTLLLALQQKGYAVHILTTTTLVENRPVDSLPQESRFNGRQRGDEREDEKQRRGQGQS